MRVELLGAPALRWVDLPELEPIGEPARGSRTVIEGGRAVEATEWWRPGLAPGAIVTGPAVIAEPEATTYLGDGERAIVHESGALVVEW